MNAKQAAISEAILALVSGGMTPIQAAKHVLGTETIDTLVSELYQQMRGEMRPDNANQNQLA